MNDKQYDFGIIGAGSAGYTAAIRASQLGKSVVLFEKDNIGGTCLNKGCIPTKTYLHSADLYNSLKKISNFGIEVNEARVDFEKINARKNTTVEKIRKSLEMLLKNYNIEIINAEAQIKTSKTIEANNEKYICENILIATGAEPKCVGGLEFDHEFILNSNDVLELTTLPQKIAIVGSGAIGIEWARIFSSFGTEVTIIEIADRLLPLADFEISQRLERIFKMAKIKTYLNTSVKEIIGKKVTLSSGEILEPEFILFATGRIPLSHNPSPPNGERNILIGDAAGSIQLAHYASHQGVQIVENIVFNKEIKEFLTPSVVYGNPEIAWVGKTEQELQEENIQYKKSIFPVSALGKAQSEGNLEGFIKVLAYDGIILGAHIISKEASALIHQLSIAMQNNLTVEDLTHCCFAHPTYSEGIYESLLGLDNLSLSLLKEQNA